MADIQYHSIVLFVNDVNISKKFYQDLLKMKIEFDFGSNILFKGGLSIWKVREGHEIKKGNNDKNLAMELYFETESFIPVVDGLKQSGVKLLHDVKEETWGQKTIRFYDPDGNLIEFGESMATFVKRLAENMSLKQVADKTGIDLADVERILSVNENKNF